MHWITTAGNGTMVPSLLRGDDTDAMNGNAIMYDIGKILTVGGAQNYDNGPGSNRAYDLQFARALTNSVVLPSGEVVVIGGLSSVALFSDVGAVLETEIWNPSTRTFRTLSRMHVPRSYHSVALLLKNGRVWVAGT
jgi:galactose oxidase